MAEDALFLPVIQKLESRRVEMPEFLKTEIGELINELILMLKSVKDNILDVNMIPEGSEYSIHNVVEIAHDALILGEIKGFFAFLKEIKSVRGLVREIQMRKLQFEVYDEAMDVQPREGGVVELPDTYEDMENLSDEAPIKVDTEAMAFVERVIQKLDSWLDEMPKSYDYRDMNRGMENLSHELTVTFNILRDLSRKKILKDWTRLNYFLCDLVELAQEVLGLEEHLVTYFMYEKTKSIRGRLELTKMRMIQYGVVGVLEVEPTMSSETVRGEDDDEDVVGLDADVQLLLRRAIFEEEQGLSASIITGMVGVGKTTLARQVYNHAEVVNRFKPRAWVCVSSELSNKEVLTKLIQHMVNSEEGQRDWERVSLSEKMESADNPSLRRMIHQNLQGKRYFIVLDDLPKEMRLESILEVLPHEDNGSRLLLTSRSQNIRSTFHYTHKMNTLDSYKSWQLFLKTIFSGNNELTSEQGFPKKLEKKGKEVLKNCCGLPLAIKEMGRQLAKKRRSGSEWEQLLESVDLGSTLELLEVFYHKLDAKVKTTFLHLAFFKENITMRVEKLTYIWAASGMVSRSEIGSYLPNLISESIIEVKDESIDDGIKSCRLNGILFRLSIKKAEDEIGFEVLGGNGHNRSCQKPRHRVIKCSREKFNYSMNQDKHLVSLFFHGGGYLEASPSYWEGFELLRILDLEDFGLKSLPETIGTLIKLRYLGLRNNFIQELPPSFRGLKRLEVLDIALNYMMEVPDVIWEMDNLRHLYMSDVICRKPLKMDKLQSLETLTYISVDNWTYELWDFRIKHSLRKLGIEEMDGNSDVSKLFASLAELYNLENLILRGLCFRSMPCLDKLGILHRLTKLKLDGVLARLPSADNFPPNIKCLKLVNSRLDEDPMPVLGKLPKLNHLKLRNAYTGEQMAISREGFIALEVLCFEEMWNLTNVLVVEGAMPTLKKLEINNCPNLETLPEEIGTMTKLEELKMQTTKNIATKMQTSGLISKIKVVDINPKARLLA